jgi:hypothetical protein
MQVALFSTPYRANVLKYAGCRIQSKTKIKEQFVGSEVPNTPTIQNPILVVGLTTFGYCS